VTSSNIFGTIFTASYSNTSSVSLSSSNAFYSTSGSYSLASELANTASYVTSSNVFGVVPSASYALNAPNFATGSSHNITSSWASNSSTASYVSSANVVGTVTSASYALNAPNFATGSSHNITSSWSSNSLTASYVTSSNIQGTVISASYALNAPNFATGSSHNITSSWSTTSSYALNAPNFATGSSHNITASWANTSSYALNAPNFATGSSHNITASWATSASYAINAPNFATGSSHNITSSWSVNSITSSVGVSSSNALFSTTASYSLNANQALSASYLSSSGLVGTIATASYSNTSSVSLSSSNAAYSTSGSYSLNSNSSITASYITSSNVFGIVSSASYALNAPNFDTGSSHNITSSWAVSASYAMNSSAGGTTLETGSKYNITSSWATSSISSSYSVNSDSSSFVTASNVYGVVTSASYSSRTLSASYAPGAPTETSSYALWASQALSASYAPGSPTESSSYSLTSVTSSYSLLAATASYITSSNIFGIVASASYALNSPNFATGSSHNITSSWSVSASYAINAPNFATGSSHSITSSWATSASYAMSSSHSVTSSYALNAPNFSTGSSHNITSSWSVSSSYAIRSADGGTTLGTGSSYNITSSWAEKVVSSSYSLTSSFAVTASYLSSSGLVGTIITSSYSDTSSVSISSSNASYSTSGSYSLDSWRAISASYITASNIVGVVYSSVSSSYALNAPNFSTGSSHNITASWAVSASYAMNSSAGGTTLETGSRYFITSSWATSSISSSYSLSSSFAVTASYISSSGLFGPIITSSYANTSSVSLSSSNAAYSTSGSYALATELSNTASYVTSSNISGIVYSASYALNAPNFSTGSSHNITSSWSVSSSFAVSASAYLPLAGGTMTGALTLDAASLTKFGGSTVSYPALKRNGAELQVRFGNDSALAPFRSSYITVDGGVGYSLVGFEDSDGMSVGQITADAHEVRFMGYKTGDYTGGDMGFRFVVGGSGTVVLPTMMVTGLAQMSGTSVTAFGGVTTLYPALKRSSTDLQVRLANDSDYTAIRASQFKFGTGASITSGDSEKIRFVGQYGGMEMRIGVDTSTRRFLCSGEFAIGWGTGFQTGNLTDIGAAFYKDADNYIGQRNGTTAQTFRVYGTYSGGGSNYVRGTLSVTAANVNLLAESGGSEDDNIPLNLVPAGVSNVNFQGADGTAYVDRYGAVYSSGGGGLTSDNDTALGSFQLVWGNSEGLGYGGVIWRSGSLVTWSEFGDQAQVGQQDTGIGRLSAGVVCVNDGTSNLNYRDLALRTLMFSGSNVNCPALINNGTELRLRLADDSDYTAFAAGDGLFNGKMGVGTSSPTSYVDIASNTTSSAPLRIRSGSAPTSPNNGDIWNDYTRKALSGYVAGVTQTFNGTLFVQTGSVTVENTTDEFAVTGSGIGTLMLPADFLTIGKTIKVKTMGYHSSTSSPNINLRLRLNGVEILTTGNVASGNGTNATWNCEALLTCQTDGASGTIIGQGSYEEIHSSGTWYGMVHTAPVTIDTTIAHSLSITAQWDTADAGNTITCTNLILETIN
jgi:hypothetical protein